MRRLNLAVSMMGAALIAACATSADEDPEGFTEPTVTGLELSATVTEVVTNSVPPSPYPKIQFNVEVSVLNNTGSVKTMHYRPSCSIRLQVRTPADVTVYDETSRDCDTDLATLTVPPQSQRSFYSGIRFPTAVLGDSIVPGRYRIVAVLQTDEEPVFIEAGSYNIPLCDNLGCRAVAARGAER